MVCIGCDGVSAGRTWLNKPDEPGDGVTQAGRDPGGFV